MPSSFLNTSKPLQSITFANITTIRIGGKINHYYPVHSVNELIAALEEVHSKFAGNFTVLGGGSNVLPPDGDYGVPVIHLLPTSSDSGDVDPMLGTDFIWAGNELDAFAANFAHLAPLSGIPGTLGGAIVGNAGAYGYEISDFVEQILCYDTKTLELITLGVDDYQPKYRTSRLKGNKQLIVVGVKFASCESGSVKIAHTQLALALGRKVGDMVDAIVVRNAVLTLREEKGMVEPSFSCGSYFTNPIIPCTQVASLPSNTPVYELSLAADSKDEILRNIDLVKVSAAFLIEHAGFTKGYKLTPDAPVSLSSKHVLSIVNVAAQNACLSGECDDANVSECVRGDALSEYGATINNYGLSSAVKELECHIVDTVYAKYNIKLTPEPVKIL